VPAERVHAIDLAGAPAIAAASYGDLLARELGTPPALDAIVLDLGAGGELAAVTPGSAAAQASATVMVVEPGEAAGEPRVARVTMTAAAWRAARLVVVTATGPTRAAALAAALRDPVDPVRRPAQAVLPSATATWFVDRAAADLLLRDAQPAADPQ
jgi:6-phosphogluconolactonase/glucosamine-6-phosphate isomerase/deaminase